MHNLEPGEIVTDIRGFHCRVASRVGNVLRFETLDGKPVPDVTPVSPRMARFAALMRYHLAYNRNLDLFIQEYCTRDNLPIPLGPDGKPFRWADWFQKTIFPRLHVPVNDMSAVTEIKDEAIVDMVNTMLAIRGESKEVDLDGEMITVKGVLNQFEKKMKNFSKNIQRMDAARKLTVFLCQSFEYGAWVAQKIINRRFRPQETSLIYDHPDSSGDSNEEMNILDQEEYADQGDQAEVEAQRDIEKLRSGFDAWLTKRLSDKAAKWFTTLFDIYWEWITNETSEEETDAGRPAWMPARRELEPRWSELTGLNKASLYAYIGRMHQLLGEYIKENRDQLGESNIWVKLLDNIEQQRNRLNPKKRKPKQKPMPAHAALAALELAQVASTNSSCLFIEAQPGAWYCILEDTKFDDEEERFDWMDFAKAFGPFKSYEEADQYLIDNFPNPGGGTVQEYNPQLNLSPQIKNLLAEAEKNKKFFAKNRWGSVDKTARLVSGPELTPEMREQVVSSFPDRWTVDNSKRLERWGECEACDIENSPFVGGDATGHNHPTIPLVTDDEWIGSRQFHFYNDGRLNPRSHAERMLASAKVAANDLPPGDEYEGYSCAVCHEQNFTRKQDGSLVCRTCHPQSTEPADKIAEFGENVFPADLPTEEESMLPGEIMDRDHEFCPECGECTTCNLRPCRGGGPHKPGIKKGANEIQSCCGAFKPKHKEDCEAYNQNFDRTIETLKNMPKRSAVSEDLADAAENLLQARSDQMTTAEDWDILNESLRLANRTPLREACVVLLHAHDNGMLTSEEWEGVAQSLADETGRNVGWRSHDEMGEEETGPEQPVMEFKDAALGHEFYDGIRPQITEGDTGRVPHGRTQGSKQAGKKYVRSDGKPFEGGAAEATHIELNPDGSVDIVFPDRKEQNPALDKSMLEDMIQRGYVHELKSENNPAERDWQPGEWFNRNRGSVLNKNASSWRVTVRNAKGKTRTEVVRGLTYAGAEKAMRRRLKPGEQLVSMTIASKKATGAMSESDLDEYPTHQHLAKRLGGRVVPFDVYQGPYVFVPNFGKFWFESDGDMACIYNETTKKQSFWFPYDNEEAAVDATLETFQGMDRKRMEKQIQSVIDAEERPTLDFEPPASFEEEEEYEHTAAGPITPQQMQQQNVVHSQGGPASPAQQQPVDPDAMKQPNVAVMPESGIGDNVPMRKTVPPELSNAAFHMSSQESSILVDKKKHFDRAYRKRTL